MKFTIERDELLRGLGRIQAIVERRGTLPILSNGTTYLSTKPPYLSKTRATRSSQLSALIDKLPSVF